MTTDLPIVTETDDDADASTPEAIATAKHWRALLGDRWHCVPSVNGGFVFTLAGRATVTITDSGSWCASLWERNL